MSTTMIVQRPGSPWPTWLGWGLLGGVLGVSGAVIHDNLEETPMPAAIVATYGRTATVRVPGGALDSWVRLGQVDYDPRTEIY